MHLLAHVKDRADRCLSPLSTDVLFTGTADGKILKLTGRRIHTVTRLGKLPCGKFKRFDSIQSSIQFNLQFIFKVCSRQKYKMQNAKMQNTNEKDRKGIITRFLNLR